MHWFHKTFYALQNSSKGTVVNVRSMFIQENAQNQNHEITVRSKPNSIKKPKK